MVVAAAKSSSDPNVEVLVIASATATAVAAMATTAAVSCRYEWSNTPYFLIGASYSNPTDSDAKKNDRKADLLPREYPHARNVEFLLIASSIPCSPNSPC
jgi:hypothetical protein